MPEPPHLYRFHERVLEFESLFLRYRCFIDVVDFIYDSLTEQQRALLEVKVGDEVVDLKTQLLIHYEDRYEFWTSNGDEVKDRATRALNRYRFLWDSDLEPWQIRKIFVDGIMEAITVGPQTFFAFKKSRLNYDLLFIPIGEVQFYVTPSFYYLRTRVIRKRVVLEVINRYPNLPVVEFESSLNVYPPKMCEELAIWDYLRQAGKLPNFGLGLSEFFKRNRFFFERLMNCEADEVNKFKEKVFQDINRCAGKDRNRAFSNLLLELCFYRSNLPQDFNPNVNLKEVVDLIVGCFSEEDLENLSETDSMGKEWSFRDQLLDRYYSMYPSSVSLEDLHGHIVNKVSEYKSLLIGSQFSTVKEMLFSDFESELFVLPSTHTWNREMLDNLSNLDAEKIGGRVKYAVDLIMEVIGQDNAERLILTIDGKEYDLRTQLLSRGKRSGLFCGRKKLRYQLFLSLVKYSHLIRNPMTRVHLQTLLEALDPMFLYPRQLRFWKWLFSQDDTGHVSKWIKNMLSARLHAGLTGNKLLNAHEPRVYKSKDK